LDGLFTPRKQMHGPECDVRSYSYQSRSFELENGANSASAF